MARKKSCQNLKKVRDHQFNEISEAVYNSVDHFEEKLEALQKVESDLIEYGLFSER